MKKLITSGILLLIYLAGVMLAQAEPPLTGDDIRHFINAMKPLKRLGEKYDFGDNNEMMRQDFNPATFSPMTNSLEKVKLHQAFPEFNSIIQTAGFSSAEQWATAGDRIMRAYISLKIVKEITPEKRQKMQKSIAEIENNKYLSPESKKQILNALKQSLALAQNMSHQTKADQDTLKPYLARLERLFEDSK